MSKIIFTKNHIFKFNSSGVFIRGVWAIGGYYGNATYMNFGSNFFYSKRWSVSHGILNSVIDLVILK